MYIYAYILGCPFKRNHPFHPAVQQDFPAPRCLGGATDGRTKANCRPGDGPPISLRHSDVMGFILCWIFIAR